VFELPRGQQLQFENRGDGLRECRMPSHNLAADDEPQAFGSGNGVSGCGVLHLP
jgi:hypothetical protein